MAKKGGMPIYKSIDNYIENQSEESQEIIREIRSIIKDVAPKVKEAENYKVPSFKLIPDKKPEHQIMIVAYKNFVSFYPSQATIEHFSDELTPYQLGKGTVNFRFDEPIPKKLIRDMILFRKNELQNS